MNPLFRSNLALTSCALLLGALGTACGTSLPAVLSSTPESVAVEFSTDGDLIGTKKLADQECAKYNLIPSFDKVQPTATPKSRVAEYRCVSPDVAAPPPAAATPAPAATSSGEPTTN
jgi:hypothetical protein